MATQLTHQRLVNVPSPKRRRRWGFALVLVLGLLSITVALAYGMMRSQVTAAAMQQNFERFPNAKDGALAGLNIGLRKLSDDTWPGFGTGTTATISGTLGNNQSYVVTYTSGDVRQTTSSPEYVKNPYRITVSCTATASTPGLTATTTHTARAIVDFVPRQLVAEPPGWADAQNYSVYQWESNSSNQFRLEYPLRIEGNIRIRSTLDLWNTNNGATTEQGKYYTHLKGLYDTGTGDYRPFVGDVSLPYANTDTATRALLTTNLGLTTNDSSATTDSSLLTDYGFGTSAASYRIFPKGKLYNAQTVSGTLTGFSSSPNTDTNPLGIVFCNGNLTLNNNVNIVGGLFVIGDLQIDGYSIDISAVDMPAVSGTNSPVQLPIIACEKNITVKNGTSVTINGAVFCGQKFKIDKAAHGNINCNLVGRLLTKEMFVEYRNEFDQSNGWWSDRWTNYTTTEPWKTANINSLPYYPFYLEGVYDCSTFQRLKFLQPGSPVTYHWKKAADNTVFVAHTNDASGLRWNVLAIEDSP